VVIRGKDPDVSMGSDCQKEVEDVHLLLVPPEPCDIRVRPGNEQ
jgi:hypothetical protein